MRTYVIGIVIILILVTASASYAGLFSWKDRNGNTHLTDDVSKVPPEYQSQARSGQVPDEEETEEQPAKKAGGGAMRQAPEKKAEKRRMSQTDQHTDKYGRGEEYWRGRVEELRQRIEDLEQEYEAVCAGQRECEARPHAYGKRPDCSWYDREKEHVQANISQTKKALEVDLPEEARKAEAYPGWLR